MAATQVNGDTTHTPQSLTLQHLLGYPIVSDGVHTVSANEYAQRSFKLGDAAYKALAGPVLPWLAKPYSYVSPYFQRADTIGEKTLERIDERFPVIKKPTSELFTETRGLILLPYQKSVEGKDHVFQVYAAEYKKIDQQGLVAQGKAAVTTAIVVSNETLTWLSNLINAKKTEATEISNEKINQ